MRWRTASERSILDFDVYRSEPGRAKLKLNRRLIAARSSGHAGGASYRLVDRRVRPGVSYTYHLRVVRTDGDRGWFGATSTTLLR